MIFKELEGQLRPNWLPVKLSKQRVATDEGHEIAILQIFEEEPHVGQREVAKRVGISQSSVCRIANENKFHPYYITLVQGLTNQQIIYDQNFVENVLFSDKASFSNNGDLIVIYATRFCVNWAFPRCARISIWPLGQLEKPNLHRNELHTKFYCLKRRP
jgi:hypothetical protein